MWEESQVKSEQMAPPHLRPNPRRLLEMFLGNREHFCRSLLFVPCCLCPKIGLAIQLVTQRAVPTIYLPPTAMEVLLKAQLSFRICKP